MATTPQQQQAKQDGALARVLQSPLVVSFAQEYKVDPAMLFGTLLRTVFPKGDDGKPHATVEQFVAFLSVAQQYRLNPFLREIYAFPTKGGGICPVVPIDGWIKIIQSQQKLDGIKYVDSFDNNGNLVSITCVIRRKDMSEPIEVTEYMVECERGTEPWRKWPRRMLRHKATIQCARIAFGLAGIYDPDEGERIIETEGSGRPEIMQPQRAQARTVAGSEAPASVIHDIEPEQTHQTEKSQEQQGPQQSKTEPAGQEPTGAAEAAQELFPEEAEKAEAPAGRPEPKQRLTVPKDLQITEGQKKKLFAVMNSAKAHTEQELYAHIWAEYGLEHIHELPKTAFNELLAWAGGDKLKLK